MRSIKWCHYQWLWTNPNPVFEITPFFTAEYLTNGYRYGHSYYRRWIGNRTKLSNGTSFYDLEWPLSQISRSRYYSTSNNSKWYKIELCLQWLTSRKSYMIYETTPFSMTLNDPYPRFLGHAIFDAEYLRNGTIYKHSSNGILFSRLIFRLTVF